MKTKITPKLWLIIGALVLCCTCKNNSNQLDKKEVKKKVGQLFLLAFSGSEADIVIPFIKERGIGGLYLSNENLQNPVQSSRLLNELQVAALNGISKQPLLTSCDQEGAWAIMVPFSTTGPGNMALGASEPQNTETLYNIFGKELEAIGVFCNLAPDADVNSNPKNLIIGTRSFGENEKEVAERVKAAIKGLHKNNIIATVKHFPGHGNTSVDSHEDIPHVSRSLKEIESIDIYPFKVAIESGVDIVMTSHIIYDVLDKKNPATLSKKILNGYLRDKLGFEGIILSDSYNMGSIQKNYDPSEAAINAINAGVDMIMLAEERYGEDVGDYVKSQIKMLDNVEKAVIEGKISMERLNDAYNRIISLKEKYNLKDRINVNVELAEKIVGSEEHKKAAVQIAEKSVYVGYDNKQLIPLNPNSDIAVIRLAKENIGEIVKIAAGIGPNYYSAFSDFVKELKKNRYNVTVYEYKAGNIPKNNTILCVGENYPLPGKSLDIEEQLRRLNVVRNKNIVPLLYVGLKDPYDANVIMADTYISALGSNISNVKAVVNLLTGKVQGTKKLPVTPVKKEHNKN